ncbi:MAG: hypothetical protein ACREHD_21320, partial [Pirellulales bacterium]
MTAAYRAGCFGFTYVATLCDRRPVLRTFAIWIAYVALVTLAADVAARYFGPPSISPHLLHEFIAAIDEAPPLARWDSIWFYGIAQEGYSGSGADSRFTPGFLPVYPIMMRWMASLFGTDYFTAGLWISRLALLALLYLLPPAAKDCGMRDADPSAAQFALLAFPTGFILVSVYSEALFTSLALAAFVLARRERWVCAAAAAFCAAVTRPQGVALVPALAALAWREWRGGKRTASVFAPPLGAATGYAALACYFWWNFGDPLRYLTAKREGWGSRLSLPWETLGNAVTQLQQAID